MQIHWKQRNKRDSLFDVPERPYHQSDDVHRKVPISQTWACIPYEGQYSLRFLLEDKMDNVYLS
jgi:hypothetical protein